MKIAMFVAKDAALKRGSDTYGWRVADVPAVSIPEKDREFLVAHCPPSGEFKNAHDYAVRALINPCHGSSRFDVEIPPAPDEKTIDTELLLQYISTCRELVEKAAAAYEAEKALEKEQEDVRCASAKKQYEALAVRVLAGEFPDEYTTRSGPCNRVDIDIPESETLYVYRCDSEIVDKAFAYVDEAVKRFRVVLEARRAKEAAEEAEHLAKKKYVIKMILIKCGTSSQVERWEADCLPEEELDEVLHNVAHSDLRDCPRYVKMTDDDVEHVDDCQDPRTDFGADCQDSRIWYGVDDEVDSVTDGAWTKAKAIRALLKPGTDNRIRLHKAHCRADGCDTETRKYALQVRIEIPDVGTYAREYELDGTFKV